VIYHAYAYTLVRTTISTYQTDMPVDLFQSYDGTTQFKSGRMTVIMPIWE